MFTNTRRPKSPLSLTAAALALAVSVGVSGCDDAGQQGGDLSFRPGSTLGGMTLNTSNWVSPGTRDVYEFDRTGAWHSIQFGFKTRLAAIIFDDPNYGTLSTDPADDPPANAAWAAISSAGDLEIAVTPPGGGEPTTYSGTDIVGLELLFEVKYKNKPAHQVKLRITGEFDDPIGGSFYEIHKVDTTSGDLIAPICEESTNGDRNARLYGDVSIDAKTGDVTEPEGIIHIGCTAAAPGKSSLYGYFPHGAPDTFKTANRVIRADYCADGYPYTYPGNSLVIRDNFTGSQAGQGLSAVYDYAATNGLAVEAMWGIDGIICVDTPRVDNLERVDVICPAKTLSDGALVYNWTPPPCDGFADPAPEQLRFYSLTEI